MNGLYYMRQRYYNTDIKRFINQDIVTGSIATSQSLNRYSYVQGNPVTYTDPFGLSPVKEESGFDSFCHTVLSIVGILPGLFGAAADTINAGWYLIEGNTDMALISGISAFASGAMHIDVAAKFFGIGSSGSIAVIKTVGMLTNGGLALAVSGNDLVYTLTDMYDRYILNGQGFSFDTILDIGRLTLDVAGIAGGAYQVGKGVGNSVELARGMKSGNSSIDDIVDIMKLGKKTSDGRNIIAQLDDNTKVIFRMDVGENAHSMAMYGYSNPINHINIEIQVKSASGKYKTKWNFHIILDELGKVIDSFATGTWTKN